MNVKECAAIHNDFFPRFKFVWPLVLCALLAGLSARAQEQPAPSIIWRNGTPTPVIAIDSQTNVYCAAGGSVVTLSNNGAILGTNSMCPAGGLCQRDSAGNFIFSGPYTPPFNFGVTNLTNANCFIAKYNSNGVCLWAQAFGVNAGYGVPTFGDLQLDPQGNAYASISVVYDEDQFHFATLFKFDPSGSNVWSAGIPNFDFLGEDEVDEATSRIGGLTSSNGYVFDFASINNYPPSSSRIYVTFSEFNTSSGGMTQYGYWSSYGTANSVATGLHPAVDSSGNVYDVEPGGLVKRNGSGAIIWSNSISGSSPFPMAPDIWGGVYVGDNSPSIYHYDSDGNLVWTMGLPAQPNGIVSDPYGNRAVSLTTGVTYWITQDVLSPPAITTQPAPVTVMAGSNATLSVAATGSTPFSYYWLQNSNLVSIVTNINTLAFTNATTNESGSYSVIVSNFVGTTNSLSARLRVKDVELFYGNLMLTNGTYYFSNSPTFTIVSKFTNGSSFYTLDGSTPSFLSTPYSGPFSITNTTTINAIGYSADFSQSDVADTVIAVPPVQYTLMASTPGGGTVALNPSGGLYLSGTNVTVTATPAAGFSFLYWTNGASGNNPVLNVTMTTNISVTAVFGTTLSNTVAGNGQVFIYPAAAFYPYGSIVRLEALPQSNYCFGVWGNAASGSANPLYYVISNANPVISSAFAPIPGGDASFTVLISGGGTVNVSPSGNYFPLNQSLTLTASPSVGGTFLGWSGSASGTNNPLNLTLTQSEVVNANFSGATSLLVNRPGGDGLSSQGFRFTLAGSVTGVFNIQSSSNLSNWQTIGSVTNVSGTVQFTDPAATNLPANYYQAVSAP